MDKETIKHELKRHLVDSTAMVTIATPLYASLETMVVGMSNSVSLNSRALGAAITYAGLGSLTKIRDLSKNMLGINKKSKEIAHGLHDVLFTAAAVVGTKPLIYLASGESDWKKIAFATLATVGAGAAIAYPGGYLLDNYREILGIKEAGRVPEFLKKQSPAVQKTAVAVVTTGAMLTTGLVYLVNGQ